MNSFFDIYIEAIGSCGRGERRAAEDAAVTTLVRCAFGETAVRSHDAQGAPYITLVGARRDGRSEGDDRRINTGISISHSRRFAVLVVSRTGSEIGVDIESARPQLARVCRRILSTAEYAAYDGALVRAWTAKEAVYKASRRYFATEPEYSRDISIDGDTATAHTPEGDRNYTLLYLEHCEETICIAY